LALDLKVSIALKFPNLMNKIKHLITYPSLDYLELPYHLIESALLNHTSYESFKLCVLMKGICFGLDCRRKILYYGMLTRECRYACDVGRNPWSIHGVILLML
jgi:hypothetical protein